MDALRLVPPGADNSDMHVGKVIRALRQEQGLTLEELALRIGSDAGNLSRVERGLQRYTPEMLEALSEALRTPVSNLFYRAEQKRAPYEVEGRKFPDPTGGRDGEAVLALRRLMPGLDEEKQKLVIEFARMLVRSSRAEKA